MNSETSGIKEATSAITLGLMNNSRAREQAVGRVKDVQKATLDPLAADLARSDAEFTRRHEQIGRQVESDSQRTHDRLEKADEFYSSAFEVTTSNFLNLMKKPVGEDIGAECRSLFSRMSQASDLVKAEESQTMLSANNAAALNNQDLVLLAKGQETIHQHALNRIERMRVIIIEMQQTSKAEQEMSGDELGRALKVAGALQEIEEKQHQMMRSDQAHVQKMELEQFTMQLEKFIAEKKMGLEEKQHDDAHQAHMEEIKHSASIEKERERNSHQRQTAAETAKQALDELEAYARHMLTGRGRYYTFTRTRR